MKRFAIHSNRAVMPHGTFEATVVIEGQRVLMVIDGFADSLDCEVIDVGEHVLMPGLIDPHVHINEPGRSDWEGFDTGTRAAAAGGITTIVDMPLNSSPVTTTVEAFEKKLKATEGKLHVNCGFWGGIVPENASQLKELLGSGVLGIKAFLIDSGLDEFKMVDEGDLRKGISAIAESGLPLLAHSELISSEKKDIAINDYPSFLQSRPAKWEDDAIELLIRLTEEYMCTSHIVHLSSSGSLDQIKKAKKRGISLTVETCPHYLVFDAETIPLSDTLYKCAPPIREKENCEKLWEALNSGLIDFIASDHSPAPPELKEIDSGNYEKAWGGIAGLQFSLPAFWTGAHARGFTLNQLAELMSENPSKLLGLDATKGKIVPGYDADLLIWSPEEKVFADESSIQHKHKSTPYSSLDMLGSVKKTFVGGDLVYDNGEFISLSVGKAILNKKNPNSH
jgi:allantoinase